MRRETISPEFDKDTDVIKKRDVLDSLSTAINQGKKELEDIETEKKGKIKELATVVKRFDENDTLVKEHITSLKDKESIQKEKLVSINEKIDTKRKERDDLQTEIDGLNATKTARKDAIDAEVSAYEKEAKKESKALAKSILEQQATLKDLSESNAELKLTNDSLVANVKNNKEVVARATKILDEADSKEKALTTLIESKTKEIISLAEDIKGKEDALAGINRGITSKEGVLKGIDRDIALRQVELSALNNERTDFERAKLVFSEQKALILAKEQFVKEKYEMAGLKYK